MHSLTTDPRRHALEVHDLARMHASGENDNLYHDGVVRERAVAVPEKPDQDVFERERRLFSTDTLVQGAGRIHDTPDGVFAPASGSKDEASDLPELGDKDEFDATLEEQISNLRANGAKDDASEEFCRYSM